MSIKVRLQQSKFKEANRGGKWHARTVNTGDVTTAELAQEIQNETTFTRGEVEGLITELVDVIARNLRNGHTVVIDGLGRFHLSVESKPVEDPRKFDLDKNITDVKLKFVPAGKRDDFTRHKVDDFGGGVMISWFDEDAQNYPPEGVDPKPKVVLPGMKK